MDNKGGLILNPQINNNINDIIYPNNYNLLIQNHLQIHPELDFQKNSETPNEVSPKNKVENNKENEPHTQKRKEQLKKNLILEIINVLFVIKVIYLIQLFIPIANKNTIQIIIQEEEEGAQRKSLLN